MSNARCCCALSASTARLGSEAPRTAQTKPEARSTDLKRVDALLIVLLHCRLAGRGRRNGRGLRRAQEAVHPRAHLDVPVGELALQLFAAQIAVLFQRGVAGTIDPHLPAAGRALHRPDRDRAAAPVRRASPVAEEEAPILRP